MKKKRSNFFEGKKMNIPSKEECLELFVKYKTPDEILNHCKRANKTAVFLAKKLQEKGIDLNLDLVDKGSLLHDFARLEKPNHAEAGYNILKNKYPEIAKIIQIHNTQNILDLKTWEQKVVFYADKRSLHDQLVPVKKRHEDAKKRYGRFADMGMFSAAQKIEKQIFDIIGIKPEELGEYLE
jgi:HD superfamily phosphodiesterase